jgi:hypothetical protein
MWPRLGSNACRTSRASGRKQLDPSLAASQAHAILSMRRLPRGGRDSLSGLGAAGATV